MTQANIFPEDSVWKNKAFSFLVRCRSELWGKHNEDILAWMFKQGFSNQFAQDMLLGWNKYPKIRPVLNWGLWEGLDDPLICHDKLTLPPGLVIPYIVDKDLRKLMFYNYQSDRPQRGLPLPGGSAEPMVLGRPSPRIAVVFDIIHGLYAHQELKDQFTVVIPHAFDVQDEKTLSLVRHADVCLVFPDPLAEATQAWPHHLDASICYPYAKAEDIVRQLKTHV